MNLSECIKDKEYTIIREIDNNVYKVKTPHGGIYILKILNKKKHLLKYENSIQREVCFSKILGDLGIGPQIIDTFPCNNGHVIIMKCLDYKLDKVPNKILDAKIEKLHSLGIIHGDLHIGNIRCNSFGEPYILDFETAFFDIEYNQSSVPRDWLKTGYDWVKGLEDFKKYEKINYIEGFECDGD